MLVSQKISSFTFTTDSESKYSRQEKEKGKEKPNRRTILPPNSSHVEYRII